MPAYPLADLDLARRLERAEGHANRRFIEARARVEPDRGATWTQVAGADAMFDGPDSPLTQTFGLGLFAPVSSDDMEALEVFFSRRGAPVFHEVCPMAAGATIELLTARGYRPIEFTSVLYQPIEPDAAAPPSSDIAVSPLRPGHQEAWAELSARGWAEFPELAPFLRDFGRVMAASEDTAAFVATIEGQPIATGALAWHGGVALLAGASTVPEARGRGAQAKLLEARLAYARALGCTLAMMGAQPGSGSQRNAERNGFRIAYTRIKWQRLAPLAQHLSGA